MIKTILLLTPGYVTLFWSILLNFRLGKEHAAKRFLGKFMLACVVVYLTHFFYYSHIESILRVFEPIYQLASLSVYPLFYIYFRLLTVEHTFTLKKHGIYLILPIILTICYGIGAYLLPGRLFLLWLYDHSTQPNVPAISYLNIVMVVIALVNVGQIFFTVLANLRLIKLYQKKAIHYYSDIDVVRSLNVVVLNIVLVVCGISSILLSILGRTYFITELTYIALASILFSSMLFVIGWIGYHQNAINQFEEELQATSTENSDETQQDSRTQLMERITNLFRNDRIHLNTKLTIQDVAQTVGTNRTYVSSIINQHYGVNFCTFVNNFRIEELEHMLKNHPELTNQILAESCGFGSVDSLKRAVNTKTGLSVTEWKATLANNRKK